MTQEQYNRAVEINKRLEELIEIKETLERKNEDAGVELVYRKYNNMILPCPGFNDYLQTLPILNILDRHDKMIREEIDADIEKLKKEIEEL